MPDPIFSHPRLAAVYDAFDGDRADLPAYLAIADELDAASVLDVGCGTGSLAAILAGSDRMVIGVDPAAASLEIAKAKAAAGHIAWVHGDIAAVTATGIDLAVMTGNVAQVFLYDKDWAATLRQIYAVLRPGGYLVFETRRPERRIWEDWAAGPATLTLNVPGIGAVRQRRERTSVRLPFVSFRYTYEFGADGTTVSSESTLRFRNRDELDASLTANGFRVLDVREAADRPGHEFVYIAQRS